jgi:cell division septation protein DedD
MGVAIAKGILKTLGVEFKVESGYWKVQVGAYLYKDNAVAMQKKIKAVGFDAFIVKE